MNKKATAIAATLITAVTTLSACAPGNHPNASVSTWLAPRDKSGEEVWSENCTRCHNARPVQQYSDAQWDLIVHHMRLRANLTGDEQRKIVAFLQASN